MMGRSLVLGDIRHIEFHLLAQVRPWLKFLEPGSGAIGFFECPSSLTATYNSDAMRQAQLFRRC
jgi:hypothetical protein